MKSPLKLVTAAALMLFLHSHIACAMEHGTTDADNEEKHVKLLKKKAAMPNLAHAPFSWLTTWTMAR